tara:strand:+ start:389 stop:733 length:345 start_codon:yes stop_codon:yes gene_type:complete
MSKASKLLSLLEKVSNLADLVALGKLKKWNMLLTVEGRKISLDGLASTYGNLKVNKHVSSNLKSGVDLVLIKKSRDRLVNVFYTTGVNARNVIAILKKEGFKVQEDRGDFITLN